MKLLSNDDYEVVEKFLYGSGKNSLYVNVINEVVNFFDVPVYKEFLQLFYFDRSKYKNRYPDNRSMLSYLCSILYVRESTLYIVRKEILYKTAMILYKHGILK